jgi:hypothetical protein
MVIGITPLPLSAARTMFLISTTPFSKEIFTRRSRSWRLTRLGFFLGASGRIEFAVHEECARSRFSLELASDGAKQRCLVLPSRYLGATGGRYKGLNLTYFESVDGEAYYYVPLNETIFAEVLLFPDAYAGGQGGPGGPAPIFADINGDGRQELFIGPSTQPRLIPRLSRSAG